MSETSSTLERHPSLYFADGDIALSAKTAAGVTQVFRIDRIFLSRHSEVFRDMLMVSSDSTNAGDMYDGVPLVSLPGDSAEDVQSLLEVMYDLGALHEKLSASRLADLPITVGGLMRIVHKYLVTTVQATIIKSIISQCPQSLAAWDLKTTRYQTSPSTSENSFMEPAAVIQFFRLHADLSSLPPSVFYQLSITPTNSHWQDSEASDTTAITHEKLSARWSILNGREAMLYIQGRDALAKFAWDKTRSLVQPFGGYKCTQRHCATTLGTADESYFHSWHARRFIDILSQLRLLADDVRRGVWGATLCTDCQPKTARLADELRSVIWEKLPEFFPVSSLTSA